MPLSHCDLYTRLEFDPLEDPSHPSCVSPCNDNDSRRRVESLALEYIRGRHLYIHTATLKGPFGQSWKSPWTAGPTRTKSSIREEDVRQRLRNESGRDTLAVLEAATARLRREHTQTSSSLRPSKRQRREVIIPRTDFSSHPEPESPDCSVLRHTDPNTKSSQQNPNVLQADQVSRKPKTSSRECSALKSDQLRLSHAPPRQWRSRGGKSLLKTTEAAHKRNDHSSKDGGIREVDDEELSDIRSVSFQGSLMRQRYRAGVGSRQSRKKSAPKDRRCKHCDTRQSHQWRRGPDGPGTLCSSCGAKWTFKMKKNDKSLNRTYGDQSSNESEIVSRASKSDNHRDGNDTGQTDPDIRHNGIFFSQPDPISRRQVPLSSIPLKAGSFPVHRAQQSFHRPKEIQKAVFPDNICNLEKVMFKEAVNLRRYPAPLIQKWHQHNVAAKSHANNVTTDTGISEQDDGLQNLSIAGDVKMEDGKRLPKRRKRRLMTFDMNTPQQSREPSKGFNIGTNVLQKGLHSPAGNVDALELRLPQSPQTTASPHLASPGQHQNPHETEVTRSDRRRIKRLSDMSYKSNNRARGRTSLPFGSSVKQFQSPFLPTQLAMDQAHRAFQYGLDAPNELADGVHLRHHLDGEGLLDVTSLPKAQRLKTQRLSLDGQGSTTSTQALLAEAPSFDDYEFGLQAHAGGATGQRSQRSSFPINRTMPQSNQREDGCNLTMNDSGDKPMLHDSNGSDGAVTPSPMFQTNMVFFDRSQSTGEGEGEHIDVDAVVSEMDTFLGEWDMVKAARKT